ncbi:MAG: outer membrane lipoprotein-sorting protein [Bacteroidota bacterium]|nr:outer membrane lipoprotein-sorting protein [Bacteroidota bacterium]
MKKSYLFFISAFIISVFTQNAICQTVDEVINNHANTMGGADKFMNIKTVKYSGQFSGDGVDIPMTMVVKRDGKAKMEMTYQGMNLIRASDGTSGWTLNPFQGGKEAQKIPAEEFKEMRKSAEIEGELINYKDKGYKAELLGKDDFEGSEIYKIKLTDKDGDVTYYLIDISTYLILKDSKKRKVGEKEINSETIYGNYQKVDGLMFPMSLEYIVVNSGSQKVTVEKVELNTEVDDSVFKMPVK